MARFVERMERRWAAVQVNGLPIDVSEPYYLITEVCLTDDMNADIATLMKHEVGEQVADIEGDVFKRVI